MAFFLLASSVVSLAADQAWTGGNATSGNWSTVGNWSGGAAPGATYGNTTTATATFNASIANGWGTVGTPIIIDSASQNIKSITFTGSTGSYFIGSTGGNPLLLTSGGAITLATNATGTNLTETINAPITLYGNYSFINAVGAPGSALVFTGNITAAAASTLSLTSGGIGVGTGNLIGGNISDGAGVMSVSVTSMLGKWTLNGTNTYSGNTTINCSGGTVVLSGTNTSNGSTTINNGILQLNNSNNGGLARGLLILDSGALQALTATSGNLSNAMNVTNNGTISGAQNVTINGNTTFTVASRGISSSITGGNSLTLAGNVFLGSNSTGGVTSTLSGTGNTTISGNIADYSGGSATAPNNLVISNTGITTLSGTNTYTGNTTLSNSTVSVGSTANLGAATNTLVFSGGTLRVTGTTMNNFGSHTLSYIANLNVGLDVNNAANNFTISTAMTQGTGGLTKLGAGTLTLSVANTYTGNTTISAGTLAYGANNALSTGNVTVSGGTLDMGIYSDVVGAVTLSSGNITGTTGVLTGTSYLLTGNGSVSAILGGVSVALTKSGAGTTATLSGTNTYTGVTTISGGTLSLGGAGALNGGGNITFTGGSLQFTANNTADYSASIKNSTSAISIDTNGQNVTFGSALAASNNNGLTKSGAGTLTLNATNLYTGGTTTVNAGTLLLNAASTYAGTTTVNATLQLSGAGTLTNNSSVTLNNGGTFVIDNTIAAGGNNNTRLGDSTAFTLAGGTFIYKGSDAASTNSTETIGAITQGIGSATVTITAGGSNTAQLTANTFNHSGGYGVTLVNGASLGSSATASARFLISTSPTMKGTTAGTAAGINSAVKNTQIVPYLVGEATATAGGVGTTTGTANTFLTWNATSGLRPLNLADEFISNAFTAGNNTYITASTTANNTVSAGINSLIINGGDVSIDDGVTLASGSGAILFSGSSGSNSIKPTGTTGNLMFGSSTDGMVTVNSGVTGTISANIIPNGPNNLTKSGLGTLVLSGTNSYNGTTGVTGGTLKIGSSASIPGALTTGATGTFDLNGYDQTLTGLLTNSGTVTNSGAIKTLTVGNGTTGAGNFTGAMNVIWNQAAATSTLSGSWSNTGDLTLNANGVGGVALSGIVNNTGNIALNANSTGTITVSGIVNNAGTITNNGSGNATTTISGIIGTSVTSVIQNSATSQLTLSGASTFAGGVQVISGNFSLSTAAGAGTGAITLGTTGGTANAELILASNNPANAIIVTSGTGSRTIWQNSGGSPNLTGNITLDGNLIVDSTAATVGVTLTGTITGNKTIIIRDSNISSNGSVSIGGVASSSSTFTGTVQVDPNGYFVAGNGGGSLSIPNVTVNVLGTGLFSIGGGSPTIGGLTGNGTTQASANKTLTLAGSGNYTYDGIIQNGGVNVAALTMIGSGKQILTGNNTYSGGTIIYGGTLSLARVGGTLLDAGNVTVSGGTLDVAQNDSVGIVTLSSGTISGAGTLTGTSYILNPGNTDATSAGTISAALGGVGTLAKSGTGTVTLSGNNTYSGATTITAGMLQSAKPGSLSATSGITITTAGSTLAVNYGGVSDYAAADIVTLLNKTTFSSNSTVFAFDTTNGSGTYGNSLTMNAVLTKLGANTLTLTAANSNNGSTTIGTSGGDNAGTLSLSGSGTISNIAATLVYGGTLDIGTTTAQTLSNLTLGGGASGSTASVTIGSGGNLTLGGTVTYSNTNNPNGATISGPGTINLNATRTFAVGDSTAAAADLTVSAVISDGNSTLSGLTKTGAGTLVLSGNNTYTGITSINAGVVSVSYIGNGGTPGNLGAALSTESNINLATTLQYTGPGESTNRLFRLGVSTDTLDASGTGAIIFANPLGLGNSGNSIRTLTLTGNSTANNTLNPIISNVNTSNATTLVKTGVGTWVLAGNNTYTGTTTISGGTLEFAKAGALYTGNNTLWTAANVIVAGGGTLALNVGGASEFTTGNVTTLLNNLGGGNGTSTAGFASGSKIAFDTTGGNFALANNVADSTGGGGGHIGLTKLGGNTLTLNGSSTYTGTTTISAGTLQVGAGTDAGSIDSTSAITNNGALVYNVGGGNRTVAVAISGNGSFTQAGSGTTTLSATNTYTGSTLVTSGTLVINGSLTSSPTVTVSTGAKLGGIGKLTNATIGGGGMVGPGNSPGILTASAVNPTTGLGFSFEYTNTGAPAWGNATDSVNDVMRLTSATPFTAALAAGTNTLNFYLNVDSLTANTTYQGGFFTDQSTNFYSSVSAASKNFYVFGDGLGNATTYNSVNYYTLAGYNTAVSGTFNVTLSTLQVTDATFADGTITTGWVTELTVVPEPSTWALLAFSLTTVMILRRRRR